MEAAQIYKSVEWVARKLVERMDLDLLARFVRLEDTYLAYNLVGDNRENTVVGIVLLVQTPSLSSDTKVIVAVGFFLDTRKPSCGGLYAHRILKITSLLEFRYEKRLVMCHLQQF